MSAPDTTWLLVMISPSPVITTPEPVDWPPDVRALISTMAGLTALATAETPLPLLCPALTTGVPALLPVLPPAPASSAALPPPMRPEASATAAIRAIGRRALRCSRGPGTCGPPAPNPAYAPSPPCPPPAADGAGAPWTAYPPGAPAPSPAAPVPLPSPGHTVTPSPAATGRAGANGGGGGKARSRSRRASCGAP